MDSAAAEEFVDTAAAVVERVAGIVLDDVVDELDVVDVVVASFETD